MLGAAVVVVVVVVVLVVVVVVVVVLLAGAEEELLLHETNAKTMAIARIAMIAFFIFISSKSGYVRSNGLENLSKTGFYHIIITT